MYQCFRKIATAAALTSRRAYSPSSARVAVRFGSMPAAAHAASSAASTRSSASDAMNTALHGFTHLMNARNTACCAQFLQRHSSPPKRDFHIISFVKTLVNAYFTKFYIYTFPSVSFCIKSKKISKILFPDQQLRMPHIVRCQLNVRIALLRESLRIDLPRQGSCRHRQFLCRTVRIVANHLRRQP